MGAPTTIAGPTVTTRGTVTIDIELCKGCELCIPACPPGVLAMSEARNDRGELVPTELKAGDRVLFGKWSGTEVKINGEDLLIMKESDVMGVIEKTSTLKKAA